MKKKNLGQIKDTLAYYSFDTDPDWVQLLSIKEALTKNRAEFEDYVEWPVGRYAYCSSIFLEEDDHTHYHYQLIQEYRTKKAIDQAGEIEIDFLPHYQKLVIHRINVVRKGDVLNKLQSSHYFVSDTVRSNADQLHAGPGQIRIVFNDLHPGDILDFSYSVLGVRPSMTQEFTASINLTTSYSLMYRRLTVIKLISKQLYWKGEGETYTFSCVNVDSLPGYDAVCFTVEPTYLVHSAEYIPLQDDPESRLFITDQKSWSSVVATIMRDYQVSDHTRDYLRANIMPHILKLTSVDDQIVACLDYVQRRIRYVSFNEPVHFRRPYSVEKTIENGFGDCKDKSFLLVAMLEVLGIEAFSVLVNSTYPDYPSHTLPTGSAFNHVIVFVFYQGKEYWVDPTCEGEEGNLSVRGTVPKGDALILSPLTQNLVRINADQISCIYITESFDFTHAVSGQLTIAVETIFRGSDTCRVRSYVAEVGEKKYKQDLIDFYKQTFPRISWEDFSFSDDTVKNVITVEERYIVENVNEIFAENGDMYWLPHGVSNGIKWPEEGENRQYALSLPYGLKGNHVVKVIYPRAVFKSTEPHLLEIKNDHFDYRCKILEEGNQRTFLYSVSVNAFCVNKEDLGEYLQNAKEIRDCIWVDIPASICDEKWLRKQKPHGIGERFLNIWSGLREATWYFFILGFFLVKLITYLLR
ncbi:DUF3857 domain-containing transglutaminase family protein [Candidatus Odyssella acanthamoebae]|uniref:DUF3857 domain-containing protein n=1 Tax=Candidatus Odyssella acanthamoebae TaxID=91604 RepID=A0A077ASC2_9PROT|nr:DUF3857 domain-containing transglutaminase family protein [Candidatus Paracaedibacter acanthamoebae]AIK96087.1 hypothetical protein ID47_04025 [Candidatus Paracaedibacter acanthamoebae]